MSDTTPSGPQGGKGASDEPPQPGPSPSQPQPAQADGHTEADEKDELARLFGTAARQPDADDRGRKATPPWDQSARPAKQADDDGELFAQRLRQMAKELAEAPPAKEPQDDSPILDVPADSPAAPDVTRPPDGPASIDSIIVEPPPTPAAQHPGRRARSEEHPADKPSAAGPAERIAEGHRMSGARHEPRAATEQRRPSIVTVEPGGPLALPQADPQYLQKVQDDLTLEDPSVIVRYGAMRQTGLFEHHLDVPPTVGTKVVIRSERGVELGRVVSRICTDGCSGYGRTDRQQVVTYVATNGPKYRFQREGKVLRVANTQDLGDDRALAERTRQQAAFCRQQIADLKLNMRVITVENLLGGDRIVFYFTSEERVDFRELVRRLTGKYHTRVELRQVGARDEARLVGDFERCGRQCCCRSFIKDLQPVSMRMAKLQKATLDPLKISGRCSRLMCCLRYEDESYKELRKNLPKKNTWVRTESLVGKVVDAQVLTQLLRIQMPDRSQAVIAVEEIVACNVEAPAMADLSAAEPARPPVRRSRRQQRDLSDGQRQNGARGRPKDKAGPAGGGETKQSDRSGEDVSAAEGPVQRAGAAQQPAGQNGTGEQTNGQGKRKRRKRRRKRKK